MSHEQSEEGANCVSEDDIRSILHEFYGCRSSRLEELASITVTFGKHEGKQFVDIPLRYLDETISAILPANYTVRMAAEFVDMSMSYIHRCRHHVPHVTVPNLSLAEIANS